MQHIALLKGGMSSERDVSLATAKAVRAALDELGYQVTEVDVGRDVSTQLTEIKPDIAFNALHGTYGEDGCIQGVLEILNIPYTHSGVLASAMAMHKPTAKRLFKTVGLPVAEDVIVSRTSLLKNDPLPRPYVIKPLNEGSSVGVLVVMEGDTLDPNADNFPKGKEFLVEKYIAGRELTVGVMDNNAMGVIEIRPKQGFYDYRNKYTSGMTEYIVAPDLPESVLKRATRRAERAHQVLGCRGISRADFRYDEANDEVYILEVNTHPGMTETSLVPKLAKHIGVYFPQLIEFLLETAQCDY